MKEKPMTNAEIESYRFHSKKYNVTGRWICQNSNVVINFCYSGEQYRIPFKAIFTITNIEWLMEAAVMMMESEIETIYFSALETNLLRSPCQGSDDSQCRYNCGRQ